jgi:FkbM family methyltransferase
VIDVGAQIGIYSLFAAKMGHSVVAVEPFEDNVVRIHKAAYLENITDKITLIKNAIADKRNEIKQLESNSINVGGQGLLSFRDKKINTFDNSNKYLVETILFDDVVNFLPKLESKKAILKIDIEGYEPYAFQYSKNLFKILDIKCIFMEWGKFGETDKSNKLVNEMLNFLFANDLRPFNLETDQELERENFSKWPWDIIWKK